MITFQSAAEDLSFTGMGASSTTKMEFTKYALLKIPTIEAPINNANSIQFNAIEGAFVQGLSPSGPPPEGDRVDLAQSLQNYLLNMETILIRSDEYNPNLDLNTSERLFWKWMKEIGAMRYRQAVVGEKIPELTAKRFVEEDDNDIPSQANIYDAVVKYIGEIEMVGNQRYNANSYRQLYFMVPTMEGSTPVVLFKSVADDNYYAGQVIKQVGNENIEYIQGRGPNDDPTAAGLSAIAFYDQTLPFGSINYTMNAVPNDVWFKYNTPNGPNAYYTDAVFEDPNNDLILRVSGPTSLTYFRSRLDGIMIDWDYANYKAFQDNTSFKSFHDFNKSVDAGDFEFNAILLYYDLFEESTPDQRTTNLYSIIFLDDLINTSTAGGAIETLFKVKPDPVTRKQGNAYGIVLNLRHDVTSDSVDSEVEISVNEYNTFSMVLFNQAFSMMSLMNTKYEATILALQDYIAKTNELEALILTGDTADQVQAQVQSLQEQLVDIQANQGVLDLIDRLNTQVNEILSGNTTVNLSFLVNFIGKEGIRIDQAAGGNYLIRNLRQKYAIVNRFSLDASGRDGLRNVAKLGNWDSTLIHFNDGTLKTAEGNTVIYIDDTIPWSVNQEFTIQFEDPLEFGGNGILLYTDALNRFNNAGPYEQPIGLIPVITGQKPSISIICIDSQNYKFSIIVK